MTTAILGKPRGVRIYRGAYEYLKNGNTYAEESFDVFRDPVDMGLHFVGQQMARVSTGEILRVSLDYVINKDFVPSFVSVEKVLGKDHVKELYVFDKNHNVCLYKYESKTFIKEEELTVPDKFYIATPLVSTSTLFIKSKKEDPTAKNIYQVLRSFNNWNYIKAPEFETIALQRMSLASESINISGKIVQATRYHLFEDQQEAQNQSSNHRRSTKPSVIKINLSKYSAIPYLLETSDGTRIQIKYFNDLEPD